MDSVYTNTVMLLSVTEVILGCVLCFIHVQVNEMNQIYRRSRLFLAAAFIVLAANSFVHSTFHIRAHSVALAISFNIASYYLMAILVGLTYIPLINLAGFGRRRLKFLLARWFVTSATLLTSAQYVTDKRVMLGITIVGALVFFVDALLLSIRFFRIYVAMVHHFKESYVNEIEVFMKYLYKGVVAIIVTGLSSVVVTYMPAWVITAYSAIAILLFIYVFVSFNNYAIHMNKVSNAIADFAMDVNYEIEKEEDECNEETTSKELSEENQETINEKPQDSWTMRVEDLNKKIMEWIENKEFCKNDISINNMAAAFCTNRQYLYKYFKEVKNTNKSINFLIHPNEIITESNLHLGTIRRSKNYVSYLLSDVLRRRLKQKNLGLKAYILFENEIKYWKEKDFEFVRVKDIKLKYNC